MTASSRTPSLASRGRDAPSDPHGTPMPRSCSAARDLRKRYGEIEAVKGVSFEIHEGETYGLLGPNGAGKTTTISMVCGLLARDARRGDPRRPPIDVGRGGREGRHRVRAPGAGDLPGPVGAREPRVLRPAVRPRRRAAQDADRARSSSSSASTERANDRTRPLQRRHAAPAQHRHRAAPPAAPAAPRRAHGGRGPPEPQRDPRVDRRARPGRAWRSCTRRTTWRRPSASATGSGSSTAARSAPRAPARSSSR